MGTNQIKSIRRTKKSVPTINEHRKEKTYRKRVSVSVSDVWLSKWPLVRVSVLKDESV